MKNVTLFRRLGHVSLTAFAFTLPIASCSQSTYTIVDIGILGQGCSGNSISNNGKVTGTYALTGSMSRPFRYENGIMTPLPTLGGLYSYGQGINNNGSVVGTTTTSDNLNQYAAIWTESVFSYFTGLGISSANGINENGWITGTFSPKNSGYNHVFVYDGTTIRDLRTLGGSSGTGSGINMNGQVAGWSNTVGNLTHAFRYTGGTMVDLGTLPGGTVSLGFAINASGWVAGYSTVSVGPHHAVVWYGNTPVDLGSLNGNDTVATSINASGQIVGYSYNQTSGVQAGFIYTNGLLTDLNTLIPANSGWTNVTAGGINDSGWITGGGTFNGQQHACILMPNNATALGRISLEGVSDLSKTSSSAPLGTFHISIRMPGTTTEQSSKDVALTTMSGSKFGTFTLNGLPSGLFDVAIKGSKSLRVVISSVTLGNNTTFPDATLPNGDANNDNRVDVLDFGVLVNAYGGNAAVPISGYNPSSDFNYDGSVDVLDFGLLVNNYGNVGAQ